MGGAAAVKAKQVKEKLVTKGSNWLIAKDVAGDPRLSSAAGRRAIIDGVPRPGPAPGWRVADVKRRRRRDALHQPDHDDHQRRRIWAAPRA